MHVEVSDHGDAMVVSVRGEIDLHSSGDLRTALLDCVGRRGWAGPILIVDLAEVAVIDSSGIASLLEGLQGARRKGKEMILASPSVPVMRVFRLARLESVFVFAPTIADALAKRTTGVKPPA